MELEIHVPDEVPVMTLPNVALFPQALLPLHIFEARYRRMLRDVLAANRLFAIAGLSLEIGSDSSNELTRPVACMGIVRACQKNSDGTSNLLLQGLCRVAVQEVVANEPYPRIRIRPLASEPGAKAVENTRLCAELARMIKLKLKLSASAHGMADFLKTVDDPEAFADIAAFNLCEDPVVKQKLLETLDVNVRLGLLLRQFRSDIDLIMLRRRLQGGLPDDRIETN